MQGKNKLGIGIVMTTLFLLVIILALADPVSDVNLQAPTNNYWTNQTNETLRFQFNYSGSATNADCTLKLNGEVVGQNATTNKTNTTTLYVNNNSKLIEGYNTWRINCDPGDNNDLDSSPRTLGIDRTAPTTLHDNTGWYKNTVTINLTANDTNGAIPISGIAQTYYCTDNDNTCYPITAGTTATVSNIGTSYVRFFSTDNANNEEIIKSTTVNIEQTAPTITLVTPSSDYTQEDNNTVIFRFNSTDTNASLNHNCTLYINNTATNNTLKNNATIETYTNSLQDNIYSWYVSCADLAGNVGTSETRTITMNVAPHKPTIETPVLVTNANTISIVGYVNKSQSNITVYATKQGQSDYLNWSFSTVLSTEFGETIVFSQDSNNSFIVAKAAPDAIELIEGRWVYFSSHNKSYLQRYNISSVGTSGADYYRIVLSENLEEDLTSGDSVYIHNSSKPSGWFNNTVTLHLGNNTITAAGNRGGSTGLSSDQFYVFKDTTAPSINLTSIVNTSAGITPLTFVITDNYGINSSTIYVNLTNSTGAISQYYGSNITVTCNVPTICTIDLSANLNSDTYNLSVNIDDLVGQRVYSSKIFFATSIVPTIVLESPENNYAEEVIDVIDLTFNFTSSLHSTMNCSFYVNNLLNMSNVTTQNATSTKLRLIDQTNGDYSWYVSCTDGFDLTNTSEARTYSIGNNPIQPLVETTSSLIKNNYLQIIGYVNRTNTDLDFTIVQGLRVPRTQSNATNYSSTLLNRSEVVAQFNGNTIYIANADTDMFNETLQGAQLFIEFSNHDTTNFERYGVNSVVYVDDIIKNKLVLDRNLSSSVSSGVKIRVYNSSYPTGWFNVTLRNIYNGSNNITLTPERIGIPGTPTGLIQVFYDNETPSITTTNIRSNYSISNRTISFTMSDNYAINKSSLLINITNGTNYTAYVWESETVFNTTNWNLGENISCSGTTIVSCDLTPQLEDGNYNLTIQINDTIGWQTIETKQNITIDTSTPSITSVQDQGVTTISDILYANWSAALSADFSHYEYSVGTTKYPTAGYNNIVNWTNIGTATNVTTAELDLSYGTIYYFSVKALDIYGNFGYASSNGIILEDNSTPTFNSLTANNGNYWTNSASTLSAWWNFTDTETGISGYEYTIGTEKYPTTGWNNIVEPVSTTLSNITVTGLTLENGEEYYFNVRAENNYAYGFGWSIWQSSVNPVRIDIQAPTNGSISYQAGPLTAGSVTVTYSSGNDSLSGIKNIELRKYETSMDQQAQCGSYGSSSLTTNLTATGLNTNTYTVSNLEDGKCYKFELWVYDNAGNKKTYTNGNQAYNLVVDTSAPSTVSITTQPSITTVRDLTFIWTASQDLDSGINNYEYSVGTSVGQANIFDWTNTTSLTATLQNLNLTHEGVYYFSVRAYNNLEIPSTITNSNEIIYLDQTIPNPLTIISVGNDTNSSGGYIDLTLNNETNINLTGEEGLTCVWSFYDIYYVEPGQGSYNYSDYCTNTRNDNFVGYYSCNITPVTEGTVNVHVICKDSADNKQSASGNTDITFVKENQAPEINITSPVNNALINSQVTASAIISDASNYSARYELRDYYTNNIVLSGLISDINNIIFDVSNLEGTYKFYIIATDTYNYSRNKSVTVVIDNSIPSLNLIMDRNYWGQNFNLGIEATLYTNLTYNITNSTNHEINSSSNTSINMNNFGIWNKTIEIANFPEGNYTLVATATNNNSNTTTVQTWFVIDKTYPRYFNFDSEPTNIYDNETIELYLYWEESESMDSVWVTHNANGTNVNYTASLTTGEEIFENSDRWTVSIPSYMLNSNETISYTWHARDKAYNINSSNSRNIKVQNRLPNITTEIISEAIESEAYTQLIYFTDLDNHNDSMFSCSVNGSLTASYVGNKICSLSWTNPTTSRAILVSINDSYNISSKEYNLTVNPIVIQENDINSSHTVTVGYWYNGSLIQQETINSNTNEFNVSLANVYVYTVNYNIDKLIVSANNVNASNANNTNIFFRMLNINNIINSNNSLGISNRYKPIKAYAFSINSTPNTSFRVAFNYSGLTYTTLNNLKIFKFEYGNAINYSNGGLLSSTIDTANTIIYVDVINFSAFILAEDTNPTIVVNSVPGNTHEGGGSPRGGSSSGGGSYYIPPATCEDGIKNQNELDIDCGGECNVCETCHDYLLNQDETETDCGGICGTCPAPTCNDGRLNQGEEKIDCGGPNCQACPGCYNGLKDSNEVDVDCGGICIKECEPETIETIVTDTKIVEKPVNKTPSYMWFVILGIAIIGGLAASWIYTTKEHDVKKVTANANFVEQEVYALKDEEKNIMQRYIFNYLAQGLNPDNIKNQLVMDGFLEQHINPVLSMAMDEKQVQELYQYMDNYSQQGYTIEELKEWVLNNGINQRIVNETLKRWNNARSGVKRNPPT